MNCPQCNIGLVMSERQGIEVDYCPQCRGVWLDRGELDKIIQRSTTYMAGGGSDGDFDDDYRRRQGPSPGQGYPPQQYQQQPQYQKRKKSFWADIFD